MSQPPMGGGVNDRRTPIELFQKYDDLYHFTLDGAAAHDNALVDRYCTLEGTFHKIGRGWYVDSWQDGLAYPWSRRENARERVWLNPPYGRGLLEPFIEKAAHEQAVHGTLVAALLPVRTEQPWFHEYVWDDRTGRPYVGVTVGFLKGRVRFDGLAAAPFPSMVVVWGS